MEPLLRSGKTLQKVLGVSGGGREGKGLMKPLRKSQKEGQEYQLPMLPIGFLDPYGPFTGDQGAHGRARRKARRTSSLCFQLGSLGFLDPYGPFKGDPGSPGKSQKEG